MKNKSTWKFLTCVLMVIATCNHPFSYAEDDDYSDTDHIYQPSPTTFNGPPLEGKNSSFKDLYNSLLEESTVMNNPTGVEFIKRHQHKMHMLDYGTNLDFKDLSPAFDQKKEDNRIARLKANYAGTPAYMSCQKENFKNWKDVANKQQNSGVLENSFEPGFRAFAKINEEDINKHLVDVRKAYEDWKNKRLDLFDTLGTCKNIDECFKNPSTFLSEMSTQSKFVNEKLGQLSEKLSKYYNETGKQLNILQTCAGLAAMTHYVDYDKNDVAGPRTSKTFDGKIECISDGAETQDFKACDNAVTAYNAAYVGQKGMEVVQAVVVQDNLMEKKTDLMTQTATSAVDMTKNAFELQKTSVEEQKKVSQQRVVFHGAKLAAMLAIHQMFPTTQDMIESCSQSGIKGDIGMKLRNKIRDNIFDYVKKIASQVPDRANWDKMVNDIQADDNKTTAQYKSQTPQDLCRTVIDIGEFSLTKNQRAKDAIKEVMMTAGINMASDGLTASILDKQADRLEDAIASIDGFKPEDLPGLEPTAVLRRYCQQYPNDPKCSGLSSSYQGQNWDGGGFGFNGGSGLATEIGAPNRNDPNAPSALTGSRSNDVDGAVFSPIDPVNKQSGFTDPPPMVGASKEIPAGGGGVGGAVGGGEGGLSGGGGKEADQNSGPKNYAGKLEVPQYGGGGADFKYLGGKGLDKKTAQGDDKNPLADFFKQKDSAKKNDELNFGSRSIASKEGSSLWELISNRYSKAQEKKQLLDNETIENSMDTDI